MSFQLYRINELYSDGYRTTQFIELSVGNADGQSLWAGVTISSTRHGITNTFTFPSNLPSNATANTTVLLATQSFADRAGVTPDFIIPDGFLFTFGGTLNFGNADIIDYPVLLTADSLHSHSRDGSAMVPSPRNFAGETAPLPEPLIQLPGTAGEDIMTGGPHSESIAVLAGNDYVLGSSGNDSISGGTGIDTAVYPLARIAYTLRMTAPGEYQVEKPAAAGTDSLVGVERLQFSDMHLALDLDGHAGQTARLLGAVFGAASVANKAYAGVGLALLDSGTSYEALAALAVQAAGKSSHADVVALLWTNLVGSAPTAADAAPYVAMLDGGMSIGALAAMAADLPINAVNIDLTGLAQTGLAFTA
ncbi:calcium-binding protein [Aquincola sp. S2]|uniref:Calcium-binding protein n=1 Tax=Pseudaquabacterium terrae TaxID=2732868 RepID=A0ABX2ED47_9BURK|nr:calcium-binding protein [Aquabacterium terrae]NRF65860.1 calcium-binding protein [Aquabacterium terrae]